MAALGALIQATMAGEPLGLLAVNVIGFTVRVSLNLNFEPAVSIKEPALPSWGGFDSLAGISSPFSYTRALSAVVLPAAFSVLEPYLFSMDNDFDSCGQHNSPASSSGSSSAAGSGGMGNRRRSSSVGHGGQWRCPQGSSNGRRGRSASEDGRHGGGNGDNNGNGNNRTPTPSPTRTVKDDPASTTSPPRPQIGGAPPPPPPPPPPSSASGDSSDDNKDRTRPQSCLEIFMIILAGIILSALSDRFHSRFQYRSWYNTFHAQVMSFARRTRRATRYLRSVVASGCWKVFHMLSPQSPVVPQQLAMENYTAHNINTDVSHPFRGEYITKDLAIWKTPTTDLALWTPTTTDLVIWVALTCPLLVHEPATVEIIKDILERSVVDELVFVQPVLVDEIPAIGSGSINRALEFLHKVFTSIISNAYIVINGFIDLDITAKFLLVTVIGLVSYYHTLIQAVGIFQLRDGIADKSNVICHIVPDPNEVSLSEQAEEATSHEGNVSMEGDVVEGVYASMHCPLDNGSPSDPSPHPAPVEHQGGIPVTEMEFRPGYRTRRRKRCRKKKGSKLASTPDAVEPSTLNEDEDSRSLASSMWAT